MCAVDRPRPRRDIRKFESEGSSVSKRESGEKVRNEQFIDADMIQGTPMYISAELSSNSSIYVSGVHPAYINRLLDRLKKMELE